MNEEINIKVNHNFIKGVLENPEEEKLIILVHGFIGDMRGPDEIFIKLSEQLQKENYSVIRFSFSGTVPSEGNYIDMTVKGQTEELNAMISYAKSLGYSQIGVLGESMGGAIAIEAYDPSIKVVVFWYSVFDFSDCSFIEYLKENSLNELKNNGYILVDGFKIGEKFISKIRTVNLYQKLQQIKCPALFLHGQNDTDVPYRHSEKGFSLVGEDKQLNIIKGAEHCFRNEQEKVIRLTTNFLKSYF